MTSYENNISLKSECMLSPAFLDWWYSPWAYASSEFNIYPHATAEIAKRDAYRLWCRSVDVVPELPFRFDTGWCFTESFSTSSLLGSACIFAGIMAARAKDFANLAFLDLETRRWCLSVAATQPTRSSQAYRIQAHDKDCFMSIALVELQRHLDEHFPGLWSRIRLLLPLDYHAPTDRLGFTASGTADAMFSNSRAQRCWRICLNRYLREMETP